MKELKIKDYLDSLSSAEGIPGGGSGAALLGAMAAALGNMTAEIYAKRKEAASDQDKLRHLHEKSTALMHHIEKLMEKDAVSFEEVTQAYKMPKHTEQEKKKRREQIEAGLQTASAPPLELMESSVRVISLLEEVAALNIKGSIVNDIAVGVLFARTALEAAYLNVLVNTRMMKEAEKRKEIDERAEATKTLGIQQADKLYQSVLDYLHNGEWPGTKKDE